MDTSTIIEIRSIIRTIENSERYDVFDSKKKFCAYLDDIAPELTHERTIFRNVLSDILLKDLYKLHRCDIHTEESLASQMIIRMIDGGIGEKWAKYIVACFSNYNAFEIDSAKSQSTIEKMAQKPSGDGATFNGVTLNSSANGNLDRMNVSIVTGHESLIKRLSVMFPNWRFIRPSYNDDFVEESIVKDDLIFILKDTINYSCYEKYVEFSKRRSLIFVYIRGTDSDKIIRSITGFLK